MVEFMRGVMNDECGAMSARDESRPPTACPVETVLKLHGDSSRLTANSLRLTAYGILHMAERRIQIPRLTRTNECRIMELIIPSGSSLFRWPRVLRDAAFVFGGEHWRV